MGTLRTDNYFQSLLIISISAILSVIIAGPSTAKYRVHALSFSSAVYRVAEKEVGNIHLAWCREHSTVMTTELSQPWDLACGTLFQSSCLILTSPMDCYNDS